MVQCAVIQGSIVQAYYGPKYCGTLYYDPEYCGSRNHGIIYYAEMYLRLNSLLRDGSRIRPTDASEVPDGTTSF